MKRTLLALVLLFAAPAPFAESLSGVEEEALLEASRPLRTAPREARRKTVVNPSEDSLVRSPLPEADLPPLPRIDAAAPPLFSRPPPRG